MRFSWTNDDDKTGYWWKAFRAWLWFGKKSHNIGFEWHLFPKSFRIRFGLAHYDCALSFSLSFYFFSVYFDLDHSRLESWIQHLTRRRGQKYGNGREIGVSIHGGIVWFSIYEDPMMSSAKDPRWWKFHIDVVKLLFGKETFKSEYLEKKELPIPMPEGPYMAEITLKKDTWKRPRWFAKSLKRADIKMKQPIPFPGKGENSWDCGEDACHGMSCQADSFADAIGKMVTSVLRDRMRNSVSLTWPKKS